MRCARCHLVAARRALLSTWPRAPPPAVAASSRSCKKSSTRRIRRALPPAFRMARRVRPARRAVRRLKRASPATCKGCQRERHGRRPRADRGVTHAVSRARTGRGVVAFAIAFSAPRHLRRLYVVSVASPQLSRREERRRACQPRSGRFVVGVVVIVIAHVEFRDAHAAQYRQQPPSQSGGCLAVGRQRAAGTLFVTTGQRACAACAAQRASQRGEQRAQPLWPAARVLSEPLTQAELARARIAGADGLGWWQYRHVIRR